MTKGNANHLPIHPSTFPSCSTGNALFDLNTPIPGDGGFGPTCGQYNASRCCSNAYSTAFGSGPQGAPNPAALYAGYSYNQCPQVRNTSAACIAFLALEECAFSCDPVNAPLYAASVTVGLCPAMCNAWFDACRNDYTCVTDWATWPQITVANATGYFCPLGSTCSTYGDVYGSGQGLCNTMWSPAFAYSANMSTWWVGVGAGVW